MLTVRLGRPLVDQVVAALEAQLPAQLDAFNAEAGHNVTLAHPTAYIAGAQVPLGSTGFPVIEVAAKQGTTGAFTIDRLAFDHDVSLQVIAWHEGEAADLALTYEASLGYLSCCAAVLLPTGQIAVGVEVANDNGFFWRIDALPTDTGETERSQRMRVPLFMQLRLEVVEQFDTV